MERLKDTLNYLSCVKYELMEQIVILDERFYKLSQEGKEPDKKNDYIKYHLLITYIEGLIDIILDMDIVNDDIGEKIRQIKHSMKSFEICFDINFNKLLDEKHYLKYHNLFDSDTTYFRDVMDGKISL